MSVRDERKQQSRRALLDAALAFSKAGCAFSSISLRDLTKAANLVPAAFYRHFENMEQLGLELADQAALDLKHALHLLGHRLLEPADHPIEQAIDLLFEAAERQPEPWIFLTAERWSGTPALRQAVAREMRYLSSDLSTMLQRLPAFQQLQKETLLQFSKLLLPLALDWVMHWISIENGAEKQQEQKHLLKQQAGAQLELLLYGALNKSDRTES